MNIRGIYAPYFFIQLFSSNENALLTKGDLGGSETNQTSSNTHFQKLNFHGLNYCG